MLSANKNVSANINGQSKTGRCMVLRRFDRVAGRRSSPFVRHTARSSGCSARLSPTACHSSPTRRCRIGKNRPGRGRKSIDVRQNNDCAERGGSARQNRRKSLPDREVDLVTPAGTTCRRQCVATLKSPQSARLHIPATKRSGDQPKRGQEIDVINARGGRFLALAQPRDFSAHRARYRCPYNPAHSSRGTSALRDRCS